MKKSKTEMKIEPFAHLLGKTTDAVISARSGVSLSSVMAYRRKLKIPFFDWRNEKGYVCRKADTKNKMCECGQPAMQVFRGEHLCGKCLTAGYVHRRVEDFVYSGISNTCCEG